MSARIGLKLQGLEILKEIGRGRTRIRRISAVFFKAA